MAPPVVMRIGAYRARPLDGAHAPYACPMAYDEELAERVRHALGTHAPFAEIKMFGGLCFTVKGNMVVGVVNDDLMVRVGPDGHDEALAQPGARPMDFTNKPMTGFIYADPSGTATDADLQGWIDRAYAYVGPMPQKKQKPKKAKLPSRER
jgi:TfoX/Sxy family transcriptional regulator of competence genes